MIKYEIKGETFGLSFGRYKESIPSLTAAEIFEMHMGQPWRNPQTLASFASLEEARVEFSQARVWDFTRATKGSPHWLLVGQLCWIEANEYDENGEFVQFCGTYDFSAEPYVAEEEDD